ncbi:PE family protein, partial [Mycobacterium kansasii]
MSFVNAVPAVVQAAAQDLAGIRLALEEAAAAAAAPTTALAAAGEDEVSAAVAALFGTFGQEYQAVSAQASAFHADFVKLLSGAASSYVEAEVANAVSVLTGRNAAAAVGGGFNGSLTAAFNGELALQAANSLANAFGAGASGLALQTGGAIVSGIGTGLVQTGEVIVAAGHSLQNFGVLMSGVGAGLSTQASAALTQALTLGGSLSGQLGASLSGSLDLGLPELIAAFNGGLTGLIHTGQTLTGNVLIGFSSGLSELIQTGGTLLANLGGSLPEIAAHLNVAFSATLGGALPTLVAAVNGGVTGLLQTGQSLATSLAGGVGGGLSGLIQTGESLVATLTGGLSVPVLAAQLSAVLRAGLGGSLPQLVAALNGGLHGLVEVGQRFAAAVGAVLDAPAVVAALNGGLHGLVELGQSFAATLAGGFNAPALAAQLSA